ncbi:MAG: outer membrane protein [Nitrospirota bacterium]
MVAGSARPVSRLAAILVAVLVSLLFAHLPAARAEVDRPHSLGFKLGFHIYPDSSYFVATDGIGFGGRLDFQGQSLELFDYSYQWPSRWSLNVSLLGGYYQKYVASQTAQHSIFVHTATITPIYRLAGSDAVGKWQVSGGIGVGRYGLNARFDFPTSPTVQFDTYTLGYQAVLGVEYRYSETTGFTLEDKFSRARIRFAKNEFDRLEIELGGHNILFGVRIHF